MNVQSYKATKLQSYRKTFNAVPVICGTVFLLFCSCIEQPPGPIQTDQVRFRTVISATYLNILPAAQKDTNGNAKIWMLCQYDYRDSGGVELSGSFCVNFVASNSTSASGTLYSTGLKTIPIGSVVNCTFYDADVSAPGVYLSNCYHYGATETFVYAGSGRVDIGFVGNAD